ITGKIDRAPLSKKKTKSHEEKQKSKPDFRPAFGTLDAVAAPENRLKANVLMIGAAAMVVVALAVALSFELHRAAAAPKPALETSSSPGAPTAPALAAANVQPGAKNTPPTPSAKPGPGQLKREEEQPEREVTVLLPAHPSRISGARDNSAPASDA